MISPFFFYISGGEELDEGKKVAVVKETNLGKQIMLNG